MRIEVIQRMRTLLAQASQSISMVGSAAVRIKMLSLMPSAKHASESAAQLHVAHRSRWAGLDAASADQTTCHVVSESCRHAGDAPADLVGVVVQAAVRDQVVQEQH